MAKELQIVIEASDHATALLGNVRGALGGIGDLAGGALKIGLGAALGGVTALTAGLGFSVKAAAEAESIGAQLGAVLKSTGGAAGVTAQMANDLATALSKVTPFEDDAIVKGESMLLTFTNIGKDVFPQATETMLDLAQAMGGDLQGAAIQLGKALNDPEKGMTALTRVGVTFSDEQKKLIKELQAAGKLEEAQAVILAELQKEFGGSAKAAGTTFAGSMTRLQNTLGNVAESIGGGLLPILTALASKLLDFVNSDAVQNGIKRISDALAAFGAGDLVGGIVSLGAAFGMTEDTAGALAAIVQGLFDVIVSGTEPLGDYSALWETLADTLGADVATAITDLLANLAAFRDFLLTQALPALMQLWQTFVRDGLPVLMRFAQEVLPVVAQVITEVVIPGVRQLAEWALPLLAGAIKFVSDNWEVFKIIGAAVALIILALEAPIALIIAAIVVLAAAWANNWGGIRDITQSIVDTIQGIINAALAAIQGFWTAHGEGITTIASAIWNRIMEIVDFVVANIRDIVDAFTAATSGDWETFGSKLRDVWDRVWAFILDTLRTSADLIGRAAIALIQNIIDAVKDVDWLKLGQDIVRGIIKGIESMGNAIAKSASNMADNAVDAIKGFLKIHSPSDLTGDEIGAPLVEGITERILRAGPDVANALVGALRDAINAAAQFVDTGGASVGYALANALANGTLANAGTIEAGIESAIYAAVSGATVSPGTQAAAGALGREVTNAIAAGANDGSARANLQGALYSAIDNAVAGVVHSGPPYNWDNGAHGLGASVVNAVKDGVWGMLGDLKNNIDAMIVFAIQEARGQATWYPLSFLLGVDIVNGIIGGVWSMQGALADAIASVTGGKAPAFATVGAAGGGGAGNTYVLNIYSSGNASMEPVVQDFMLLKAVMQ